MDLAAYYLDQFRAEAAAWFAKSAPIVERYRFIKGFFDREKLQNADWAYFQELGKKLQSVVKRGLTMDKPNGDIAHYREAFIDLAFGPGDVKERVRRFLNLPHQQIRPLFDTDRYEIVAYLYADNYVMFNETNKKAIDYLGLQAHLFKFHKKSADRFFIYNDLVKPLIEQYRAIVGSHSALPIPLQLDRFFVWLITTKPPRPKSPPPPPRRVWLASAGRKAMHWSEFLKDGVLALGGRKLGDLTAYPDYESIFEKEKQLRAAIGDKKQPYNDALGYEEFLRKMHVGDEVYIKKNRSAIIAYGIVRSDYFFDEERSYTHVRRVEWICTGDWPVDQLLPMKTLTEITQYTDLVATLREKVVSKIEEGTPWVFDRDALLAELFIPPEQVDRMVARLLQKKNIVIQGPPGVGKTFVARKLAALAMGAVDPDRIEFVQFHQSYGYEDFIQGYRPTDDGGFVRRDGVFFRFCDKARNDKDGRPYVLVIDEINRGNLSRILGEMMMLIESDKRGPEWSLPLTYATENDPRFFVPENLLIIGTMNTADRSLAMVDYALRRRFAFFDIEPAFGEPRFTGWLAKNGVKDDVVKRVDEMMQAVNRIIAADKNLGRGFVVGHSYFCPQEGAAADESWIRHVVETDIDPLLGEYWFDHGHPSLKEARKLLYGPA